MSKRHIAVILVAGALAMLFGCHKYVDYVPLVAVDDHTEWRFEARPDLLTDAHVAAMIKQLEKYGKRYRVQDGRLQIGEDLAEDQDLLANLTEKAVAEQKSSSGG